MGEVGHAQRIDRNVGVAVDLRVDRHEVVVAVVLHASPGEIDERLHLRSRRGRLVEKVPERCAKGLAVEVARADDVEAGGLQGLGDKSGVVGRRRERLIPIGRVADD